MTAANPICRCGHERSQHIRENLPPRWRECCHSVPTGAGGFRFDCECEEYQEAETRRLPGDDGGEP